GAGRVGEDRGAAPGAAPRVGAAAPPPARPAAPEPLPDKALVPAANACAPLLPVPDLEFRLELSLPVVDLELEVLGADALLELDRGAAPVGALARPLAAEEGDQLVLPDLEVADVEPLHAALEQRVDFARRV